ncbi:MAG: 50S ribosomal protein L4 [Nanoarchaeota archaeon]|nr:50S ribosomal protein L4 [Nanoarchaeota archaeon]
MTKVVSIKGEAKGEIKLPKQFKEEVRPDLIRRAVLAIQSHKMQPYGTKEDAGNKYSSEFSKRRREYRTTYGYGQSRTPRKIMIRQGSRFVTMGATAPHTVGGRVAHPPKVEKVLAEKINDKERKKAIRSAIAATAVKELVASRGHKIENIKELPIVVEEKIEELKKAKEVKEFLEKIGLKEEIERAKEKKVRAGKGKMRGRRYKKKVGPLFVVSQKCDLLKAAKNIAGADVYVVKDLNAEVLAPGTHPGRLVIWSEKAIKTLEDKRLFI